MKKISIQGVEGAFHEIAARKYFNDEIQVVPQLTFQDVANDVENESSDHGIMAIENSIAGTLLPNYRLIHDKNIKVVGEIYLRIVQNLMVLPNQKIEEITEVHSHPIAILQCKEFLNQYPHIKVVESEDTALSAKMIKDGSKKGFGAIAGELAADLYELDIINPSIETNKQNYTRFLVLEKGRDIEIFDGEGKLSVVFDLPHKMGALAETLTLISSHKVNLSKLQSYPIIGSKWNYHFIADLEYENKSQIENLLDVLTKSVHSIHVLGSYKKGEITW